MKVKIFTLAPGVEKEINDFLSTVKILQDGVITENGMMTILYRDKDDYGMDKDSILAKLSLELKDAQNQKVEQQGLANSWKISVDTHEGTEEMLKSYQDKLDGALKGIKRADLIIHQIKDFIKQVENDEWTA